MKYRNESDFERRMQNPIKMNKERPLFPSLARSLPLQQQCLITMFTLNRYALYPPPRPVHREGEHTDRREKRRGGMEGLGCGPNVSLWPRHWPWWLSYPHPHPQTHTHTHTTLTPPSRRRLWHIHPAHHPTASPKGLHHPPQTEAPDSSRNEPITAGLWQGCGWVGTGKSQKVPAR